MPVLLLLLVAALDFGRLFFSYVEVNNAAREGVAYGAANPADTSGMLAHAKQEANAQGQGGEHPISLTAACVDTTGSSISCASAAAGGGPGDTITVTVSEPFTFLTPLVNLLFGNGYAIRASASAVALGLAPNAAATQPPGCAPPSLANFTVGGSALTVSVDGAASQPSGGLCRISGYNWDFGDGTTDVGYATGTSHTYATAGTFTVTLVVTNQGGPASTTKTVVVPILVPPPS